MPEIIQEGVKMCTAVSYKTDDHYFGRNLDLDYSYAESVIISPRNFPFHFRKTDDVSSHYAIIGVAYVVDGYPLYYDAINEKGLGIAGLNFPENADYKPERNDKRNIAPFELIPWLLGICQSVDEVKEHLKDVNISNTPFSETLPLSPLHWMIADSTSSLTLEVVKDGIKLYDNPTHVLTNNPPFDVQMFLLNNYMSLSPHQPTNTFSPCLSLETYSRGMGALGLPGDLSSSSRFVKASFTRLNSVSGSSESESISQFFHILGSVAQPRGCVAADNGYEYTIYSTCYNTDKGILYYTTYENSQLSAVDMHKVDLDSKNLVSYPMIHGQQIAWQN